jgi:predicted nucleic acid-binding protein
MMSYLADTSVVARRVLPSDPNQALVKRVIEGIKRQGDLVYVTPQVMIEFRAVATRPVASNGFGLSAVAASEEARNIARLFPLLPDTEAMYLRLELVKRYAVIGHRVHDTRSVAVMMAHGIPNILTLNPKDFRPFSEITVIDPRSLATP